MNRKVHFSFLLYRTRSAQMRKGTYWRQCRELEALRTVFYSLISELPDHNASMLFWAFHIFVVWGWDGVENVAYWWSKNLVSEHSFSEGS